MKQTKVQFSGADSPVEQGEGAGNSKALPPNQVQTYMHAHTHADMCIHTLMHMFSSVQFSSVAQSCPLFATP